ncbi:MAG: tRNA (N(6)-L-threonylcarbamoyladenosine(37)-C(2))-methylthiotransferase MtaB [Alphaproteobacteria bacterium]
MTVDVVNFGCRLNSFEGAVIRDQATAAGVDDAVVVNTCAVTAEAVRQARQAIRRAHRDAPGRRIVVTGCAAQLEPESFAALPGVAQVLGNEEKLKAASYAALAPVQVGDIMAVRDVPEHLVDGLDGRARAVVQIQQGCDHRCTFCIIPFARGNSRSVPLGMVVDQVRKLVENGYREVVLTGVDMTSWGQDLPVGGGLGTLVRRLLAAVPELPRLRLSSIDCIEADAELMRALAEEARLMPHLHLSLQAGDDLILKRMKRRHARADAVAFCDEVRRLRPDVAFGADLIAGFPTEDDTAFDNTAALIDDCGLAYTHIFPFSARPGTPAARMPQLPKSVRKERAARLREIGAAAHRRFLDSQVGRKVEVLMERDGLGRAPNFASVAIDAAGPLARARIVGIDNDQLVGMPA